MRSEGFEPVFDANSRLLILGSFPSVKSRLEGFYYANPQNRFWRTVCSFFKEEVPITPEAKRNFLLRQKIALWDIVLSCEITGSADAAIRDESVADLSGLMKNSQIEKIFCNGTKSYTLLSENFPNLLPITIKLPSTSSANPRFSADIWWTELKCIFR